MKEVIDKITESEFEVLKAIWSSHKPITFTDIREYVQDIKDWNQSTVKTLLDRLNKKGAISQTRKDVYYYEALVSEKQYNEHTTQSLIDRLYKGKAVNLITALVNRDRLDEEDIDELRILLHEEDQ